MPKITQEQFNERWKKRDRAYFEALLVRQKAGRKPDPVQPTEAEIREAARKRKANQRARQRPTSSTPPPDDPASAADSSTGA